MPHPENTTAVGHDPAARTLGEPRSFTLGGPLPAALGPAMEYTPSEPGDNIARLDDGFAATLERPDGEIRHLYHNVEWSGAEDESTIKSFDVTSEHTARSDWKLEVPGDRSLNRWTRAEITVTNAGRIVFVGDVTRHKYNEDSSVSILEGTDSSGNLTSGDRRISYANSEGYRVLRNAISELAPNWDWYVMRPPDPRPVDNIEATGSPFDILQELHEQLGFQFAISHRSRRRATSFKRNRIVRQQSWKRTQSTEHRDTDNYYNAAVVRGKRKPGILDRYEGSYIDWGEVERLADYENIPQADAIEWYSGGVDPDLESAKECELKAERLVDDLKDNDELSGDIDIPAQLVDPGYSYAVNQFDEDRVIGPFSAYSDGDTYSHARIPINSLGHLGDEFSLCFWVRADWSSLSDNDARLLGSEADYDNVYDPVGFDQDLLHSSWRTHGSDDVRFIIHTRTPQLHSNEYYEYGVRAFDPDVPAANWDNQWVLVHYDVEYDADERETTLRGGHHTLRRVDDFQVADPGPRDGIVDESVVDGRPRPPDMWAWLMQHEHTGHFVGNMEYVEFYPERLRLEQYERLAVPRPLRDTHPMVRYPMWRGTRRTERDPEWRPGSGWDDQRWIDNRKGGTNLYDVIGGYHGEDRGLGWQGTPQVLEKTSTNVSHRDDRTSLDFVQRFSVMREQNRIWRELQRTRRSV